MTKEQYETYQDLYAADLEWQPTWGFGGATGFIESMGEDHPEHDVTFRVYVYSPCFDCENGDCEDNRSCDEDLGGWIDPDGKIHFNDEVYNNVEHFLNSCYL